MVRKIFLITCLLFGLAFMGCTDVDEKVVGRYDENGVSFSPAVVKGAVEYIPTMKPSGVRLVFLNDKLDSIGYEELPVQEKAVIFYGYIGSTFRYGFQSEEVELESPYVKVVSIFPMEGSDETMEFSQYLNVTSDGYHYQYLLGALSFSRVTKLVKEEGYKLDDAVTLAEAELEAVVGKAYANSLYKNQFGNSSYHLGPYFYCRYFESDSTFYSDFKDFQKRYEKGVLLDSAAKLHLADGALRFEERISESSAGNKLNTRDSLMDLYSYSIYMPLWDEVYGTQMFNNGGAFGTLDSVKNKNSEYNGRAFVYDGQKSSYSTSGWSMWRLVSSMEDTLGLCLNDSVLVRRHNGEYYLCAKNSSSWKVETNKDTLLTSIYGACDAIMKGWTRYLDDTLYLCVCPDGKCQWKQDDGSESFSDEVQKYANSTYLNFLASMEFGACTKDSLMNNRKEILDGQMIRCVGGQWKAIDSLEYYVGRCGNVYDYVIGDKTITPDSVYLECLSTGKWDTIPAPDYYGDSCKSGSHHRVVFRDNHYYICEVQCPACIYSIGTWELLTEENAIPPVLNMDQCDTKTNNRLVEYDSVFYRCLDGDWSVAPDSFITPPVLKGLVCNLDENLGEEVKVDTSYYVCDSNYWKPLAAEIAILRKYEDKYGKCDGITGSTLYYSEDFDALYGCVETNLWSKISYSESPLEAPAGAAPKKIAGGVYENDSTYKVTVDGTDYVFYRQGTKLTVSKVDVAGATYDAYFYGSNLFIHSQRGTGIYYLHALRLKQGTENFDESLSSASFMDFYDAWAARVTPTNTCTYFSELYWETITYTAEPGIVTALSRNEDTFVSWETAKTFCPTGFHVPDSTEFTAGDFLAYPTMNAMIRNDSPISESYQKNACGGTYKHYYTLLWTSTEKDENTQYCYEYGYSGQAEVARRIVECPKDLFPMAQVVCVKD